MLRQTRDRSSSTIDSTMNSRSSATSDLGQEPTDTIEQSATSYDSDRANAEDEQAINAEFSTLSTSNTGGEGGANSTTDSSTSDGRVGLTAGGLFYRQARGGTREILAASPLSAAAAYLSSDDSSNNTASVNEASATSSSDSASSLPSATSISETSTTPFTPAPPPSAASASSDNSDSATSATSQTAANNNADANTNQPQPTLNRSATIFNLLSQSSGSEICGVFFYILYLMVCCCRCCCRPATRIQAGDAALAAAEAGRAGQSLTTALAAGEGESTDSVAAPSTTFGS